tara:strand:+ start:1149 stop:1454 length:306 start_codon:yes stop_codon:yes gene_type:complete
MTYCISVDTSGNMNQMKLTFDDTNKLGKYLNPSNPRVSFAGRIGPKDDIVVCKAFEPYEYVKNKIMIRYEIEESYGTLVLVKMDENAQPQDLYLREALKLK